MRLAARERAIGGSCAILSVLLFSSFTLASRAGLSSRLSVPDIAALRFGIGGLVLLPVLMRYGLAGVRWRDAATLAFFGGMGFALVAYAGFALAPAAHGAVLLHGALPMFTLVMSSATSRQRGNPFVVTGSLVIAVGVALIAYDSFKATSLWQLCGDGFLLLASLLWSAYGVWVRRLGLPPAQSAAIVAVFSMCCFLPVYAFLPGKALFAISARELLLQAVVQGILIGAVSLFIYTRAVTALGAATTALFAAAVPCVTTVAAMPLLSEFPNKSAVTGVAVVTIGMVLAARPRPTTDRPAAQGH